MKNLKKLYHKLWVRGAAPSAVQKLAYPLRNRKPPERLLRETDPNFLRRKQEKLTKILPLLKKELPFDTSELQHNFLSPEMRTLYDITDTEKVSSHKHDENAQNLVDAYPDGWILDCGAGKHNVYRDNVVYLEIAPYESTDVLAVAEELPFEDNVFDAVICLNVLEHVKYPFTAAEELARVLKPGGKLYCVVPFLQPVHAFPNHFYNMTSQGLQNLFENHLTIDKADVLISGHPIMSLTWILRNWMMALDGQTREDFGNMKVKDLIGAPRSYFSQPFVGQLSKKAKFEIASTTAVFATKPEPEM